jgi:hypothetical protein
MRCAGCVFTASVVPMYIITSDAVHPEAYWTNTTTTGGATFNVNVSDLADNDAVDVSDLADDDTGTSSTAGAASTLLSMLKILPILILIFRLATSFSHCL